MNTAGITRYEMVQVLDGTFSVTALEREAPYAHAVAEGLTEEHAKVLLVGYLESRKVWEETLANVDNGITPQLPLSQLALVQVQAALTAARTAPVGSPQRARRFAALEREARDARRVNARERLGSGA